MAKAKESGGGFDPQKYEYNECREQHVWKHYDGRIDNKAKIAVRVMRCSNCGMKRRQHLSLYVEDYGQYTRSPSYTPPPGYRIPGGIGTTERGMIRVHNFMTEINAAANKKK